MLNTTNSNTVVDISNDTYTDRQVNWFYECPVCYGTIQIRSKTRPHLVKGRCHTCMKAFRILKESKNESA